MALAKRLGRERGGQERVEGELEHPDHGAGQPSIQALNLQTPERTLIMIIGLITCYSVLFQYNVLLSRGVKRLHPLYYSAKRPNKYCSRGLVYEEGDVIILCEGEVNESVTLVHGMASETLSQEYVPVWLPLVIHVLLYQARNL